MSFLKMKFWVAYLIVGLLTSSVQGQNFVVKNIQRILADSSSTSTSNLLIYPTLAYTPETSWEFGFASLYVYHTKNDTSNRLNEIYGLTFLTLENQYGVWMDHALYSHQNKWFFLGKIRAQSFPLKYYGVGMNTPSQPTHVVFTDQILIKERILKRVYENVYFGLELDYQSLSDVNFKPTANVSNAQELPIGSRGSKNLGIGAGIVFDNRHNVLNVRDGFFSELAFIKYPSFFSPYSFSSVYSDTRIFKSLGQRNVFAAQLIGQFNSGTVPFNQLSLMGGDSMMRGYYTGRYRDKNLMATQVEMRFLPLPLGFSKRMGASIFAGVGSVFPELKLSSINKIVWSSGAGLRFLLFPKKDIYTRLDYAFTSEGTGFYFFIGEAF
jgi:hypothetical protein